jgi:hypothetical protein
MIILYVRGPCQSTLGIELRTTGLLCQKKPVNVTAAWNVEESAHAALNNGRCLFVAFEEDERHAGKMPSVWTSTGGHIPVALHCKYRHYPGIFMAGLGSLMLPATDMLRPVTGIGNLRK